MIGMFEVLLDRDRELLDRMVNAGQRRKRDQARGRISRMAPMRSGVCETSSRSAS